MAIDLLGKQPPKKIKIKEEVILHQPVKEKTAAKPIPVKPVVVKKTAPAPVAEEELGEVNLITAFKAYLRKRRIIIILISLVVFIIISSAAFYLLTRPPKVVVNTNLNKVNININKVSAPVCGNALIEAGEQCDVTGCNTDQTCVNCNCQTVAPPAPVCGNALVETGEQCDLTGCIANQNCVNCLCQTITPPAPVCGNAIIETGEQCDLIGCDFDQACVDCHCQAVILADTDLAPLRGALVKFSNSKNIYLIEWHGELRLIDQLSVIFKEGQTIKELGSRIYTISDSYQGIRQGKEVKGFVAWDPRVLSAEELELFK